jgi:basic membrane protein A
MDPKVPLTSLKDRLMPRLKTTPRRWLALAIVGAAAIAGIALLLRPTMDSGTQRPPHVTAANVSGRATACLATDSGTAASDDVVAHVWSSMQSSGTGKNIQQLIQPAANATQAEPYLGGLVNQHCDLIVTIGPAFGQAIATVAKAAPDTRFTAVDSGLTSPPTGVIVLNGAQGTDQIRQEVATLQHH